MIHLPALTPVTVPELTVAIVASDVPHTAVALVVFVDTVSEAVLPTVTVFVLSEIASTLGLLYADLSAHS